MRQSIAIGTLYNNKGADSLKYITILNVYAKQKFKICEAKPDIIKRRIRQLTFLLGGY